MDKARLEALDPHRSFIVQAPAGSGKTELLTQRYLKLLSRLNKGPEEIIAVTFTRKAAAEMRSRIVMALMDAKMRKEPPELPHARLTWQLATAALKHCQSQQWDIIAYPNRLRIVTIDALCSHLASRMPILSHFGAAPDVVSDPRVLYQKAVSSLMVYFKQNPQEQGILKTVLKQLDNRLDLAENLMIMMLGKRDQWLPHIGQLRGHQLKAIDILNQALVRIIESVLERIYTAFEVVNSSGLFWVIHNAGNNLLETNPEHPICLLLNRQSLPSPTKENLPLWQALKEFLMTKSSEFRKAFNINQGFLPPSKASNTQERNHRKKQKETMEGLIAYLSEFEEFGPAFKALDNLPPSELSFEQSEMMTALISLLPLLTAHLTLQFKETGKVDFIEVALSAVSALGKPEEPTDLALSLDYQLQHLLIDEFQDTSFAQFHLFEKLVSGWAPGEGRTLFLVGDPMQSIYRFRGAEVGLFLHVQQFGLNQIRVEPLRLTRNFRSDAGVVNWINDCFKDILPKMDDRQLGAVSYSPAISNNENTTGVKPVYFYTQEGGSQAEQISQLILKLLQSTLSIAVLVRAKHHLTDILPLLRRLNIPFEAHDIEQLGLKQSVLDLLSLTQGLLDLSDRIAWLAILRGPWCGLTLKDLYIIAGQPTIIWSVLLNYKNLDLSADAKNRLERIMPILEQGLNNRQRHRLSAWIKSIWLALGGPICYPDTPILSQSKVFFELLEKEGEGGDLLNQALFENKLSTLFAPGYFASDITNSNINPVQLMTIHKSKGLEFDVVILPCLEKITRSTQSELLIWYERKHDVGVDLIVAPRKAQHHQTDSLYQHVSAELSQKTELENARLLYVAVTRAKKQVHLFGLAPEGETKPPMGSFLFYLWPKVQFDAVLAPASNAVMSEIKKEGVLSRLSTHWQLPLKLREGNLNSQDLKIETGLNHPDNQYNVDKLTGIFVHRILHMIAELGLAYWDTVNLSSCIPDWQLALTRLGVKPNDMGQVINTVTLAVTNTLNNPIGRRILDSEHRDTHNEWAIHYQTVEGFKQIILDRSFIDQKGIRWIVDYKLAADLTSEHREQVMHYSKVISQLENRSLNSIRCGLYFPLKDLKTCWQEVQLDSNSIQIC